MAEGFVQSDSQHPVRAGALGRAIRAALGCLTLDWLLFLLPQRGASDLAAFELELLST